MNTIIMCSVDGVTPDGLECYLYQVSQLFAGKTEKDYWHQQNIKRMYDKFSLIRIAVTKLEQGRINEKECLDTLLNALAANEEPIECSAIADCKET